MPSRIADTVTGRIREGARIRLVHDPGLPPPHRSMMVTPGVGRKALPSRGRAFIPGALAGRAGVARYARARGPVGAAVSRERSLGDAGGHPARTRELCPGSSRASPCLSRAARDSGRRRPARCRCTARAGRPGAVRVPAELDRVVAVGGLQAAVSASSCVSTGSRQASRFDRHARRTHGRGCDRRPSPPGSPRGSWPAGVVGLPRIVPARDHVDGRRVRIGGGHAVAQPGRCAGTP